MKTKILLILFLVFSAFTFYYFPSLFLKKQTIQNAKPSKGVDIRQESTIKRVNLFHTQDGSVDTKSLTLADKTFLEMGLLILKTESQASSSSIKDYEINFDQILGNLDQLIVTENSPYIILREDLPKSSATAEYLVLDIRTKRLIDRFESTCPIIDESFLVDTSYSSQDNGEYIYYYVYGSPKSLKVKDSFLRDGLTYMQGDQEHCKHIVATTTDSVTLGVFEYPNISPRDWIYGYKKVKEKTFKLDFK